MQAHLVALPTEGVDRNRLEHRFLQDYGRSPSPRRAWIEIHFGSGLQGVPRVALPTEGVDRNRLMAVRAASAVVALPTEGVDRNPTGLSTDFFIFVALPTEGVDRNLGGARVGGQRGRVALPTEGVDRNG